MVNRALIFIPTLNDFSFMDTLISNIQSESRDYDILIIDDGSTVQYENTNNVYYVKLPFNLGLGAATHVAMDFFLQHNYYYLIRLDSDGQHDPKYIKSYIETLNNGSDFVVGNRINRHEGSGIKLFLKKMVHSYFYLIAKLSTQSNIPDDLNSGYLGFNLNAVKILNKLELERYPEPQLILFATLYNLKISTIDILQKKRQKGISTIANWQTLRLIYRFTIYNFIILIRTKLS